MAGVATYRGSVDANALGTTLMHEHIFVRNPELEINLPDPEWTVDGAVGSAVRGLDELYALGVRTVVDLTVPGLGRDVDLVARVAEQTKMNLVAATGWYTPNVLPIYFSYHGPGRVMDEPERLTELFLRDIREGIGRTHVRAGVIKVMTDADGLTPDVTRVMEAATVAQRETGIPISTHSNPSSRNGLEQQAYFLARGVPAERLVIGHSGDTEDISYLRELMDRGSTIGMDRFGMEHVLADDRRVRTVTALLELGYADRMILSQDAAFYSHVTPPSWRAAFAPRWRMDTIPRYILPALLGAGASRHELEQMLVHNPRRLLEASR